MSRRVRQTFESDLNLAPFIDVFVTLVVFVLLSTVFIQLSQLKVFTPGTAPVSDVSAPVGLQMYAELNSEGLKIRLYDLQAQGDLEALAFNGQGFDEKALKEYLQKVEPRKSEIKSLLFKGNTKGRVEETLLVVEAFRKFSPTLNVVILTEAVQ